MTTDSTRSRILEVMARGFARSPMDGSLRERMEAALAHLEAEGMVVVPVAEIQFARDAVEDWAGYADDYFKKRHHLAGDLARIEAMLSAAKPQEESK